MNAAAALNCIYCGRAAEDEDHVPPKCLFQRPLPTGLITVPSCRVCNRKFGFNDEYLRDALALSTMDNAGPPELATLHEAVRRSLGHRRFRPPARTILMRAQTVWRPLRSPIAERVQLLTINKPGGHGRDQSRPRHPDRASAGPVLVPP